MAVEQALYSRLTAHAGTSAIIGKKVYPNLLPQDVTLDAITYQRISATRTPAMGADSDAAYARFQVSSWSSTYSGAKALAAQVQDALQRWSGTAGGTTVLEVFLLNELDIYEDETKYHRVIQDYRVWFRE